MLSLREALNHDNVIDVLEKFSMSSDDIDIDTFQYGMASNGADIPEEVSGVIRDTMDYCGDRSYAALTGVGSMITSKPVKAIAATALVVGAGVGIKKGVAKYKAYKETSAYQVRKIQAVCNPGPVGRFIQHVKMCW